MNRVQQLEFMFKTVQLRVDDVINSCDSKMLKLMQQACIALEAKTKADEMLITSVHVKAMVLDDLRMIQSNLSVLRSALKLKEDLKMETFCLN